MLQVEPKAFQDGEAGATKPNIAMPVNNPLNKKHGGHKPTPYYGEKRRMAGWQR
jgi:hypothetical protein